MSVTYNQNAKARLKVQDEGLKNLEWEHEVLQQRFEQLQLERDDLYNKFVKAIHEVQQKSSFKNLLLEKKLNALTDVLEKKVMCIEWTLPMVYCNNKFKCRKEYQASFLSFYNYRKLN